MNINFKQRERERECVCVCVCVSGRMYDPDKCVAFRPNPKLVS